MPEVDFVKQTEHFYHIGIKDQLLMASVCDHIRRNFDYFSYNGLLLSLAHWQDGGMYGHKLVLENQYKRNFFDKTRQVMKRLNAEDLVLSAFMLSRWQVNVEPLMEKVMLLDYDNLNS